MSKPPTTHGVYSLTIDSRTWCGIPTYRMLTTSAPAKVTCKRCREALKRDLNAIAREVEKRRRGAPVTTGRGGATRRRLTLSFSPREWADLERRAGKRGVVAWARRVLADAPAG